MLICYIDVNTQIVNGCFQFSVQWIDLLVILLLTIFMQLAIQLLQSRLLIMVKAFHHIKSVDALFVLQWVILYQSIMTQLPVDPDRPVFLRLLTHIAEIDAIWNLINRWSIVIQFKLILCFQNYRGVLQVQWIVKRYELSIGYKAIVNWGGHSSLWMKWFESRRLLKRKILT